MDIFHSFHVLDRTCKEHTDAWRFLRLAFKLGEMQGADYRNLSQEASFFSSNNGQNRDKTGKYYCYWGLSMEMMLPTVGEFVKKYDFNVFELQV